MTAAPSTAITQHVTTCVVWLKETLCNLFIPKPNGVKLKESARPERGHGRLLTIRTNTEHGCLQSCCACDRSQIKVSGSTLCRPLLPFTSGCFPELDRGCSCVLKLLLNTSIVAADQVVAGGCLLSLLIPFNSNVVVVFYVWGLEMSWSTFASPQDLPAGPAVLCDWYAICHVWDYVPQGTDHTFLRTHHVFSKCIFSSLWWFWN